MDLYFAAKSPLSVYVFCPIDLAAGRRHGFQKGRSPARRSPRAGDHKGAQRWPFLRSGYRPVDALATWQHGRDSIFPAPRASRASSSGHDRVESRHRGARNVLRGRIPRRNRRLPRKNGRGPWSQNPEARRRPAQVGVLGVVLAVGYVPIFSRFLHEGRTCGPEFASFTRSDRMGMAFPEPFAREVCSG